MFLYFKYPVFLVFLKIFPHCPVLVIFFRVLVDFFTKFVLCSVITIPYIRRSLCNYSIIWTNMFYFSIKHYEVISNIFAFFENYPKR